MQDATSYLLTFSMLFGLIASLVVLHKKQQYPRELFAFYAVLGWLSWLFLILFEDSGEDYDSLTRKIGEDGARINLLVILTIWLLIMGLWYSWIVRTHRKWDSAVVSEVDFGRRQRKESVSIFKNAWEQLVVFFTLEWSLELHNFSSGQEVASVVTTIQHTGKTWRIQALEILDLLNRQYKVHKVDDWYSDEDCYLCTYGKEEDKIAILCCEQKPSETTITQLLTFTTYQKGHYGRFLVLIEQGDELRSEAVVGSAQVIYRYKKEMLNALVDFSAYFESLDKRFHKDLVYSGGIQSLSDIYTPLSAKSSSASTIIPNVEKYALDWANNNNDLQHLAILGEYGQGKSVLSLKLCLALSQQKQGRIPILIELRGKSPRTMNPEELLFVWARQYGIAPAALLKLHHEGRLVLVFEGFDEMDLTGDRSMRLDHFRQLWKFAKTPSAKLLFTGRPNFFLDEMEQRQALGIRHLAVKDLPFCELLHLELFSPDQLLVSLRHTAHPVRKSILHLLEKQENRQDSSLYNLLARPATLSLVTIIWKQDYFAKRKDHLTSALVLREYIQYAYTRQQQKSLSHPLTLLERKYFMSGIAVGMLRQEGYTNRVSNHQLQYLVEILLDKFPAALCTIAANLEEARGSLKERFLENGELPVVQREAILTDIRTSGILVKDPSQDGYFKFAHQSFMELLISEYFATQLLKHQDATQQMTYGIKQALPHVNIPQSPQIIQYMGELLANQALPENQHSAAQELQSLLGLNTIALYIGFMKEKIYLRPIPFIAVFVVALIAAIIITIILLRIIIGTRQTVGSSPLISVFYFLVLFLHYRINKYINRKGKDTLLKAQVWYKACEARQIDRIAMRSVIGSLTLNYIERYLRRQGITTSKIK